MARPCRRAKSPPPLSLLFFGWIAPRGCLRPRPAGILCINPQPIVVCHSKSLNIISSASHAVKRESKIRLANCQAHWTFTRTRLCSGFWGLPASRVCTYIRHEGVSCTSHQELDRYISRDSPGHLRHVQTHYFSTSFQVQSNNT